MDTIIKDEPIIEEKKINKYKGRYAGRYTEKAKQKYIENKEQRLLYRKERYELKKDEINEKAKIIYNNGKICKMELEILKQRISELEKVAAENK